MVLIVIGISISAVIGAYFIRSVIFRALPQIIFIVFLCYLPVHFTPGTPADRFLLKLIFCFAGPAVIGLFTGEALRILLADQVTNYFTDVLPTLFCIGASTIWGLRLTTNYSLTRQTMKR